MARQASPSIVSKLRLLALPLAVCFVFLNVAQAISAELHPDRQMEILARKVGAMLMVGVAGTAPTQRDPIRVAGMIERGEVGGVILFSHNVRNSKQIRLLTDYLKQAGGSVPPFMAIDQEGGFIQRLSGRKGFHSLPSAKRMVRRTLCAANRLYAITAEELADHGFNLNFGPVVDLDINPRNPAIGRLRRSYGTDPELVVAYAHAFINAHAVAGVLTAAKHFPGHGSAVLDPHKRVVDITKTWQPAELEPFARLADHAQIPMIMVGHLIHPRFSDGNRPTSLSRRAITGELRQRLGFEGIVVTDDLGMDAITERYGPETAAIMAIRAGANLLVFANQRKGDTNLIPRVTKAVVAAAVSGRVPVSSIEESFDRLTGARRAIVRATPHDETTAAGVIAPASLAHEIDPPAVCPEN